MSIPRPLVWLVALALQFVLLEVPSGFGATKSSAKSSQKKSAPKAKGKSSSKSSSSAKGKSSGKKSASSKRSSRKRQASSRKSQVRRQQTPEPDRIREIQQALKDRGYAVEETGVWDSETVAALKKFQEDKNIENLSGRGKLDPLTLIALGLGPKRETPQEATPQPASPQEGKTP